MANLNGIRFRFYNGITVGDINDTIDYILEHGGGEKPSDYVERINPSEYSIGYTYYEKGRWYQNEIYFASINGQSVIGKTNIDIPVVTANPQIQPTDTLTSVTIGNTTYNVGGGSGTAYWGSLAKSATDPTTIESFMEDHYCPESFAVELDERLEDVEASVTQMAPKVARALLTPLNPPSAIELVGIGTNGSQQQIHVGDGLEVVNSTIRATGGSGGAKYYLHTVSFNTTTSPEIHFQVGVISKSASTYANFDAFWNDRKKIVTLFGTPNMTSNALYFNGAMADNFAIKARGVTFENGEFFTDVIDIEYSDIDAQSFGDYGVEEL